MARRLTNVGFKAKRKSETCFSALDFSDFPGQEKTKSETSESEISFFQTFLVSGRGRVFNRIYVGAFGHI